MNRLWIHISSLRGATAAVLAAMTMAGAASAAQPVVVELFQSQGCSSCPPANANVMALSDRPDVLTLSFGVTYWDQLGWKDTFASAANTQRQYAYAASLPRGSVYTPQVIINGRSELVGTDRSQLDQAIRAARPLADAPALSVSGDSLSVAMAAAPKGGADIWLVRYDPRIVQVAIKRGENGGRTLPHRNVVRELVRLGAWSGAAQTVRLPAAGDPALRSVILVQGAGAGPILSALKF